MKKPPYELCTSCGIAEYMFRRKIIRFVSHNKEFTRVSGETLFKPFALWMRNDISIRMFGSGEIRHPDLKELLKTLKEGIDYNAPFSIKIGE